MLRRFDGFVLNRGDRFQGIADFEIRLRKLGAGELDPATTSGRKTSGAFAFISRTMRSSSPRSAPGARSRTSKPFAAGSPPTLNGPKAELR